MLRNSQRDNSREQISIQTKKQGNFSLLFILREKHDVRKGLPKKILLAKDFLGRGRATEHKGNFSFGKIGKTRSLL